MENIVGRNPWMRSQGSELHYSQDVANNVQSIVADLELSSLSAAELQGFIQDIRANPKQLNSHFKDFWPGGK